MILITLFDMNNLHLPDPIINFLIYEIYMTFKRSTACLTAIASALTFINFSVLSNEQPLDTDDSIEVITVNSDFRQQNLQQTPASLSILTSIEIKQRNAQHLEELVAISPNVNFASGSR